MNALVSAAALSMEGYAVIWLRLRKLSALDLPAARESRLMLDEKVRALVHVQAKILSGAFGYTPQGITLNCLQFYLKAVRSNRRRLTKLR